MGELRVDPIDLQLSSAHMEMHHAALRNAHAAANESIEAAQVGWVGAASTALQLKFAEWQAATERLSTAIAAHGVAFHNAAASYSTVDAAGAETLDQQL